MLSGASSGPLVARLGIRGVLGAGAGIVLLAALAVGLHPPFALLVALNLLLGFGSGVLDTGLNTYLTRLPRRTALLNLLHAFFGVGALLGPLLAAEVLTAGLHWYAVYLLLATAAAPLLLCFPLGGRSRGGWEQGCRPRHPGRADRRSGPRLRVGDRNT